MLKHIENVKEFDELYNKGLVVVDFFATWCGPCRMLGPIIEELANDYEGKQVTIAKLDVDKVGDIATRYGIYSVPTVLVFKNGELVEKLVGYRPKQHFEQIINKNI